MNSSLRIACLLATFLFLAACSGEPQGGWLYFGPECPEGYSNCSNPRTQEPRLVILADNEPRGIGITFQCEHDGMTARFSPGAGGSLGGAGTATMEIEVGQAGHSSLASGVDDGYAVFRHPDAEMIAQMLWIADETGQQARIVVTGAGNQRHSARFDTTGTERNLERLPCYL